MTANVLTGPAPMTMGGREPEEAAGEGRGAFEEERVETIFGIDAML